MLRYLAGLRCDGSERDSFDEDPTEFFVCNESNNSRSLPSQEPSEDKFSVERVCSIASQDTEADVNLDLDMVSKEDVDSSRCKLISKIFYPDDDFSLYVVYRKYILFSFSRHIVTIG